MTCSTQEPVWDVSQKAFTECSSLVAVTKSPFIIGGIVLSLLRYHFSNADNIENEKLKRYIWSENTHDTKMWISTHTLRDNETVQQRPALYVRRGSVSSEMQGLASQSVSSVDVAGLQRGKTCQAQLKGNHDILVFGKTGAEADNLSEEIFFRMLHYAPSIRDDIRIGSWQVQGISEIQEIGSESSKMFVATIRINWGTIHKWRITPDTPPFTRINVSIDPQGEQ